MKPWSERPTEVAYNFNPAFCGWLLREATEGYCSGLPDGLPFPLIFLVLPVVLHQPTRELLPRSAVTALHPWLREHPEVRIGMAERAEQLAPLAREAVLFLSVHGLVTFTEEAKLVPAGKFALGKAPLLAGSDQVKACVTKARMVGTWFAGAGDLATVYQMWGVRP